MLASISTVAPATNYFPAGSDPMKTPLDSVTGTVLSGVVLTAILFLIVRFLMNGGHAG